MLLLLLRHNYWDCYYYVTITATGTAHKLQQTNHNKQPQQTDKNKQTTTYKLQRKTTPNITTTNKLHQTQNNKQTQDSNNSNKHNDDVNNYNKHDHENNNNMYRARCSSPHTDNNTIQLRYTRRR